MPKDKSIDAKKTPEKQGEIKAFEKKDKSTEMVEYKLQNIV